VKTASITGLFDGEVESVGAFATNARSSIPSGGVPLVSGTSSASSQPSVLVIPRTRITSNVGACVLLIASTLVIQSTGASFGSSASGCSGSLGASAGAAL
jgi:hypothetical protein